MTGYLARTQALGWRAVMGSTALRHELSLVSGFLRQQGSRGAPSIPRRSPKHSYLPSGKRAACFAGR
jgi:hypothetical protein